MLPIMTYRETRTKGLDVITYAKCLNLLGFFLSSMACSPCPDPNDLDFYAAGACVDLGSRLGHIEQADLEAAAFSVEAGYNERLGQQLGDLDIVNINESAPIAIYVQPMHFYGGTMGELVMRLNEKLDCLRMAATAAHEWMHAVQNHKDSVKHVDRINHIQPYFGAGSALDIANDRLMEIPHCNFGSALLSEKTIDAMHVDITKECERANNND